MGARRPHPNASGAGKVIVVLIVVLLVVVVGVLLFVVQRSGEDAAPAHHHHDHERDRALRHARKQLHNGHIDPDQYERIVEALRR